MKWTNEASKRWPWIGSGKFTSPYANIQLIALQITDIVTQNFILTNMNKIKTIHVDKIREKKEEADKRKERRGR